MKYLLRITAIGLIPLTLLIILGSKRVINFNFASSSKIIHVSQIKQDAGKSRRVKISGTVTKVIPLVSSVAYQVKDDTGEIWVLSENEAPQVDQNIIINGTLKYQNINIGEEDFGSFYVLESTKQQINE
jgi:hypothetical protein